MSSWVIHIALCAIVSVPAHILYRFVLQMSSSLPAGELWVESISPINRFLEQPVPRLSLQFYSLVRSGRLFLVIWEMGKRALDPEVIMKATDSTLSTWVTKKKKVQTAAKAGKVNRNFFSWAKLDWSRSLSLYQMCSKNVLYLFSALNKYDLRR